MILLGKPFDISKRVKLSFSGLKRQKPAVQQLEQQPLFSFNRPEEVAALSSCDFTVALPKFTIPDKKVLIIEIQERNGGRHFYYKLKNKQLINAEILFPEIVGKP
jgi:hypothetical protein